MTNEIDESRPPEFTKQFDKQLDRLPLEIKMAFRDALALFLEDQNNSVLNNHPLVEKLAGYRSINLNGDYIAIFKEKFTAKQKIVTFHKVGTHVKLYRNTRKK